MLSLLLYTVAIVISIYWLFAKLSKNSSLSHILGPKGIPFLGNILQLDPERPFLQLAKWAKQCGGIYKLNLAGQNVLVVNDYNLIHQVLVSKGGDFSGRPKSFRMGSLTGNYSEFSFEDCTQKMKHMKKVFMGHVKMYGSGLQHNESVVLGKTGELVSRLSAANGQKVLVMDQIMESVAGIVCCLAVGHEASPQELDNIMTFVRQEISILAVGGNGELLDRFPWLRHFGNKTWKRIQKISKIQNSQYQEWKQQALENLADGDERSNSYIAKLLQIRKGENALDYTDDNVNHTVWVMFAAGIGTTTSTLSSLINILAHRPDLQGKLYAETVKILKGHALSLANKPSMHYHMATIYEALRYFLFSIQLCFHCLFWCTNQYLSGKIF